MREILILFIATVLFSAQGAAGFSVLSVTVVPPGALEDRTPVEITCEIPRAGILLYDQLVFTTDLDSPAWQPVIIIHDQEMAVTPASRDGDRLVLNGAAFNSPEPVPVTLRVSVRGMVPVNHTENQTLLDIRQIDSDGTPYAWPSGNFTVPMPGPASPDVTEAGMTLVLPADTIATRQTVLVTAAPVPSETVVSGTAHEKLLILPTPLPVTTPEKAAPAGLPVALMAAGIAMYLMRK
jgi:hypothetical protein